MNASSTLRRRRLVATLLAFLPPLASAQSYDFTGVFDPAAWTFTSGGTGSSVTWNASSSFTLTGALLFNDAQTFTYLAVDNLSQNYRISFDWNFVTGDPYGPLYDPVGFNSTQLSDNQGANTQSGSVTNAFVSSVFQFYAYSDNWSDPSDGRSSLTISNFSYTLAAPDDPGNGGDTGAPPSDSTSWFTQTGNWTTSANWSAGVPSSTQQVNITGDATVNITTAAEAHSVYLETSALNITGAGSLVLANPWSDFAADYGATFTVSGSDASWTSAGSFTLYTATATFDHGATGSTGDIDLAFADDNIATLSVRNGAVFSGGFTRVGVSGRATINIESGASVTLGDTILGYDHGSEAHLTVTGPGTTLSTGFLNMAEFSPGTMTISNGAVVTSTRAAIAYGSANSAGAAVGSATVTGEGSRWEIADYLGISHYTTSSFYNVGTLTITDGGLVRVGSTGSGSVYIARGGTLNIGTGGAAGILQAGTVEFEATSGTAALIAFNHSDDLTFSAPITGRGRLTKAGAGTLTLTAANTYTQNTTVTGGTLQLGNGGTTGSINGNVTVSSGASLAFNRSNNYSFSGVISGAGSVRQNGSGNLTLTGTNTHTGGTTVNAGTLIVSSNANLGNASGGVTLAGGDLRLSNNSATTFNRAATVTANSGVVSNRATDGAGVTHTLGTLSIGAHTLSVAAGSRVTSGTGGITFGATSLTGDATFNVGAGARLNLGAISGDYGFTKTGAGNLTLTGVNTFTGPLTISAGTLALASTASLSSATDIRIGTGATFDTSAVAGGYTVGSGQTLGGTGSFSGLVTLGSGAGISPGNSPGTLTFTGGLALNSGSFLDFELGVESDLILVTGGTLFGPVSGMVTVNLFDAGSFAAGTYTLIDATGAALSGIDATSFQLGATIGGYDYSFQQNGNLFQLVATTAVPEPASAAALAGLFTLAVAATRRRRTPLTPDTN